PLANAVAIPVVSVVVTPLALLAVVLPVRMLLDVAEWLVSWLLVFLEWCASLPGALWQQHVPPVWAVAAAMAGALWLLAPRGVPSRPAGIALMLPAFALAPPVPAAGEAWVTALDVGQGWRWWCAPQRARSSMTRVLPTGRRPTVAAGSWCRCFAGKAS